MSQENPLKNETHSRFSGSLGEDYDLRPLAMPYHKEFQDSVKNVIKEFAQHNINLSDIKVLEAGCGTGLTTLRILEADPRVKVIAVDNEEKTIVQAEKTLEKSRDRIDFRQEDILVALGGVGDAEIDIFASGLTIHNFTDEYRRSLFDEIFRVLKSGGLFVNADKYALDDLDAHKQSLEEEIESFKIFDTVGRPDLKEEWTKHYIEDEQTKITEAEQIDLLETLGFRDIKIIFRKGMMAVIRAIKK